MGIWGSRLAPAMMSSSAKSWLTPGIGERKRAERDQTQAVSEAALRGVVSSKDLDIEWPAPERTPPFWRARHHRRHLHRTSVRYGSQPTQLLDVWRRKDLPVRPAPVLIFVPGGAWVHGGRQLQGYALMSHLAEMGWVCLSAQYRVSPHNRWPAHITDVKTAIAWARANVDKFGGDRNFIAVAGLFGRRASVGVGRADRQRSRDAGRSAGRLGHLGGRRGGYLRPIRLGGPLDTRARTVRRLPRASRGQAQDQSPPATFSATPRRSRGYIQMPRRSWSFTAAATRSSRSSRRAASSSGSGRCPGRWSATWSCPAPDTDST